MIKKIILFFCLAVNTLCAIAQIDYSFEPTTIVQTVEISKNIGWTKSSWTLGAFVKRGTKYHCVGATQVFHPLTKNISFSIYGEENAKIGYQTGEQLQFFMQMHDVTCSNLVSKITYSQGNREAFFEAGKTIIITKIDSVFFGEIYYNGGTTFCTFYEKATPQIIDIDPDLVSFSTNNYLKIDPKTGNIFPRISLENQQDTIKIQTNHCMDTPLQLPAIVYPSPYEKMNLSYIYCDTFPVKLAEIYQDFSFERTLIGEKKPFLKDTTLYYQVKVSNGCSWKDTTFVQVKTLNISNSTFVIEEESCEQKGSLLIENKVSSLTYFLNGKAQATPFFENLKADEYVLMAQNQWGCRDTFPQKIEIPFVEKNCNDTQVLYLIPSDAQFSTLFFAETEKIQIYNKQGRLMKELYGPVEWTGIDLSGKILPTGLYVIQYQNGKQQFLKVIY